MAQMKPANSRAIAVTTTLWFFPSIFRYYRLLLDFPAFNPTHNAALLAGALHGRDMGINIGYE